MSDLQKSFARTHLSKLPPEPPPIFDEREEEEDEPEQTSPSKYDSSSSASSTGTIVPTPSKNLFERPSAASSRSRGGPLPWQDFFAQDLFLTRFIDSVAIKHHVYLTPPTTRGPLFVTHHGAGSSGLSFATFAKELLKILPTAGVLSLDARGHGQTTIEENQSQDLKQSSIDLSLPTLASDLAYVVLATQSEVSWPTLPPIVLLGHSLGGAVVTELAHKKLLPATSVLGYGVFDVVEGSAMDALQSMDTYLSTRPSSFPSLISGIEWHTRSRTIRNTTSARVSVPPLLEADPRSPASLTEPPVKYVWRTDLSATKPFWTSWFSGLSSKFLSAPGGKLLLLAGTDRLDKELMIGQMQGKYQLQVFPEAGHFVHEDQPAKTAQIVADFYRRNDRSAVVLPPKVDDLIKMGKIKGAVREDKK